MISEEKEIGKVNVGQKVSFTVSALGDQAFSGKIVSRGVTAGAISHAYEVKAVVENHNHQLLPGMVCKVRLENTGGDYSIVVPQQAIQISGQDKFVWIVKDGKAHRQGVTTGDVINEGVVVETGLTSGDVIIVQGQNKVSEDVRVRGEN